MNVLANIYIRFFKATGLHTPDRIQSHTKNQQITQPRNNQEWKQWH
jgi:hypothetical protein